MPRSASDLSRVLIRPVASADAVALHALAGHLDTVNLPRDPLALERIIAQSVASFAALGAGATPAAPAHYTVVAADGADGRLLGTATLFARHGTPEDPHYHLSVVETQVHSTQLGATRQRRVLRLDKDIEPWTELGGLVVHPEARGRGIGTLLVAARLLLVAAFPTRFCDRLLAELLPPRREDGSNAFWDAVGAPLTGLDYYRADLLCRADKEFIEAFFPHQELPVDLLPPAAQALIAVEGPSTSPARRLLRKAGFRPLGTIDPFDAGPHDGCAVAACTAIQASRRLIRLDLPPLLRGEGGTLLVMNPGTMHAERVPAEQVGHGLRLPHEIARRLDLAAGDVAWAMDLAWAG